MSFTIDNVLGMARFILQDEDKDRYEDQRLLDALNLAVSTMQRVRPDMPGLWGTIPSYPYSIASLDQGIAIPVHQQFLEPLVAYIVGWVELTDDEFAVDNRANTLLTRFTSQLTVGG